MPDMSHMRHTARSARSQTAIYFLEGLKAKAVIPSEPSTPIHSISNDSLTWDVELCLLVHIINDNIMADRINDPVIIIEKDVSLHVSF